MAQALEAKEEAMRLVIETLSDYLGSKKVLLVLENCVHFVDLFVAARGT